MGCTVKCGIMGVQPCMVKGLTHHWDLIFTALILLQPTLTGAHRNVTHDVPVTVVPERLWADYQEPSMPDIHVSARNRCEHVEVVPCS